MIYNHDFNLNGSNLSRVNVSNAKKKVQKLYGTSICEKDLLTKYVSHMKYLNIKQEKGKQKKRNLQQAEVQKSLRSSH